MLCYAYLPSITSFGEVGVADGAGGGMGAAGSDSDIPRGLIFVIIVQHTCRYGTADL
jgi:hypothetical protein